jgi:hypothetical protein
MLLSEIIPNPIKSQSEFSAGPQYSDPSHAILRLAGTIVLSAFLAVVLMVSSNLCNSLNADSILPAIISTQKVTPYYWGQNRLGNLLPLLASPIKNVQYNYLFQLFLRSFLGFLSIAFVVQVVARARTDLFIFGVVVIALVVIGTDEFLVTYFLDAQPYATSMALLAGAVWIAETQYVRTKITSIVTSILLFMLLVVVEWVNSSAILFIIPFFLVLYLTRRDRGSLLILLMAMPVYIIVKYHSDHVSRDLISDVSYVRFSPSFENTLKFGANLARVVNGSLLLLTLTTAAVVSFAWGKKKQQTALLASVAAAVFGFLILANNEWVLASSSVPRYGSIILFVLICVPSAIVADVFQQNLVARRTNVVVILGFALSLILFWRFSFAAQCNFYSADQYTKNIDAIVSIVKERRLSFIAGDYWTVWPAVLKSEVATGETIFGATFRGQGPRWKILKYLAQTNNQSKVICIGDDIKSCRWGLYAMLGTEPQLFEKERGRFGDGTPWAIFVFGMPTLPSTN